MDGVVAEISRLLKTDCNAIAPFRAGKMGRGIVVHEWCRLNECARRIAFAALFLLHIGILLHVALMA